MSKLRVYELAKELNIKPQDVLDSLKGTQYEVKTSSNSIDEDAQKLVRSKVNGAAKPAAKPATETKPAGEASTEQQDQSGKQTSGLSHQCQDRRSKKAGTGCKTSSACKNGSTKACRSKNCRS